MMGLLETILFLTALWIAVSYLDWRFDELEKKMGKMHNDNSNKQKDR